MAARLRGAGHEVALTIDAMIRLALVGGRAVHPALVVERDELFARLGIVAAAAVPLPGEPPVLPPAAPPSPRRSPSDRGRPGPTEQACRRRGPLVTAADFAKDALMTASTLSPFVNHIADDDLPWADTGVGIELKVLRVTVETGVWVVRNRFQPGVRIPRHRHTGPVEGFTLTGRWHYLEYDFWNTAGSYIHEPASSVHTLDVPADNTEPTDVLFIIEGVLLNLDDQDAIESVADGPTTLAAYLALLEAQGLGRPPVLS